MLSVTIKPFILDTVMLSVVAPVSLVLFFRGGIHNTPFSSLLTNWPSKL
jgi:hypothetical protein